MEGNFILKNWAEINEIVYRKSENQQNENSIPWKDQQNEQILCLTEQKME